MNKKGSARDILLICILIFTLTVVFFILHFTGNSMMDNLIANTEIASNSDAVEVFNATKAMTGRLDYMAFAFFIGLVLALIVTGYFVGGHPIFMFLYFIIVCIVVALSAILSNVWEALSENANLISSLSSFPIMNHILTNFPIYMSAIGILGLIVMFAKPQGQ